MNLTSKCWVLTDCPSNNQELHAVPVPRSPPGAPALCSSKEQQLPRPSTAVPAPNTHRFPSLEATGPGLSRSYQLCCLNTSRQRKEGPKTLQWRATPGQFQPPPPRSRHPRSEGDTVRSAVCAPAVLK